MKEVVIFDTNFLLNKKGSSFFGKRDQLAAFSEHVDIVIPDMVIRELEEKYKRDFLEGNRTFLKNIASSFLSHNADVFDLDQKVLELRRGSEIHFLEIFLTDVDALSKIKELAVLKKAPFEKGNGTDKGFKDAYIFITALQYANENPQNKTYFCTTDGLLKDAFEENSDILVIDDFDSFKQNSIVGYQDQYFIELLQEEVDANIKKDSIDRFSKNINDNDIILVRLDEGDVIVEVESRGVIGHLPVVDIEKALDDLINSASFATTHTSIAELSEHKQYLSIDVIKNILMAVVSNEQIYRILSDDDVKQFVTSVYGPVRKFLDDDLIKKVEVKIKGA